jgi:hypothetical protein
MSVTHHPPTPCDIPVKQRQTLISSSFLNNCLEKRITNITTRNFLPYALNMIQQHLKTYKNCHVQENNKAFQTQDLVTTSPSCNKCTAITEKLLNCCTCSVFMAVTIQTAVI